MITTVAGNGAAGYSGDGGPATAASLAIPVGLAVDAAGDLFVTDIDNRVRRVDDATGVITTVAGNGTRAASAATAVRPPPPIGYPHGLAVDAAGDLFIADSATSHVRRVDHATGVITTVAGGARPGLRRRRRPGHRRRDLTTPRPRGRRRRGPVHRRHRNDRVRGSITSPG